MRLALVLIAWVACAPQIEGPVERQRALDRADSSRLATQLAQLPGAVRAEVALHRAVVDPLTDTADAASAAILIVIDDRADAGAIRRAAAAIVRGTAPEISEAAIVIELGAVRPRLASVGPFTVEARSKPSIVAAFAIALAFVVALAGIIAWRERWRLGRSSRTKSGPTIAPVPEARS
jgi:hypothetical protein